MWRMAWPALPVSLYRGVRQAVVVEPAASAWGQGLTLVCLSAQRKRFLWNRGCNYGLFRG
jgi:hypothetical protein